jgi:hypothetical protein
MGGQMRVFQTVDEKYSSYLSLVGILMNLGVIDIDQKKHIYTAAASLLSGHNIPGHWIPLAVVSLNREYMEIIPKKRGT